MAWSPPREWQEFVIEYERKAGRRNLGAKLMKEALLSYIASCHDSSGKSDTSTESSCLTEAGEKPYNLFAVGKHTEWLKRLEFILSATDFPQFARAAKAMLNVCLYGLKAARRSQGPDESPGGYHPEIGDSVEEGIAGVDRLLGEIRDRHERIKKAPKDLQRKTE